MDVGLRHILSDEERSVALLRPKTYSQVLGDRQQVMDDNRGDKDLPYLVEGIPNN